MILEKIQGKNGIIFEKIQPKNGVFFEKIQGKKGKGGWFSILMLNNIPYFIDFLPKIRHY